MSQEWSDDAGVSRSILHGYKLILASLLVWEYLRSPAKNLSCFGNGLMNILKIWTPHVLSPTWMVSSPKDCCARHKGLSETRIPHTSGLIIMFPYSNCPYSNWINKAILVGGFKFQTFFGIFHFNPFHIWDVILPIDSIIFQDAYCTTSITSWDH